METALDAFELPHIFARADGNPEAVLTLTLTLPLTLNVTVTVTLTLTLTLTLTIGTWLPGGTLYAEYQAALTQPLP